METVYRVARRGDQPRRGRAIRSKVDGPAQKTAPAGCQQDREDAHGASENFRVTTECVCGQARSAACFFFVSAAIRSTTGQQRGPRGTRSPATVFLFLSALHRSGSWQPGRKKKHVAIGSELASAIDQGRIDQQQQRRQRAGPGRPRPFFL
jgi:hypothetical protein